MRAPHLPVVRIIIGLFFAVTCARLLPWAPELYSNAGVLADFRMNPTHTYVPNVLYVWDSPLAVQLFVGGMGLLAVALLLGWRTRVVAVLLWAGWAMLWHRNVFTANPALPFLGFTLLALALCPGKTRWSLDGRRAAKAGVPLADDAIPRDVWRVVWIVAAVGYTWSAITKLQSPSWVAGEALGFVLDGPLARDLPWVHWLVAHPALIMALTWGTLAVELLAAPLAASKRARPYIWLALTGLHVGILATVQFAELTVGMLVVHAVLFDGGWVRQAAAARKASSTGSGATWSPAPSSM